MLTPSLWADALLDPALACPPDLVTWNGSDPARRFAVYRNNVVLSLIEALAETFPVTRALAGEDAFREMARIFVRRSPPRSPVLAFYGRDFPAFIAGFEPTVLADVARLEMAYVDAFHAADAEPVPMPALQAALANPDNLPALGIRLHPSLKVLRSRVAQVSLWAAYQGHGELGAVDPNVPEHAWVLRNGLVVEVRRMSAGDCRFAESLASGLALGLAAEAASDEDAEFDLANCLATLLRAQAIIGLTLDGEHWYAP
jgi:hypothetical protein